MGNEDPPDLGAVGGFTNPMDMEHGVAAAVGNAIKGNSGPTKENITYTSMDTGPYRIYFELRNRIEGQKINKFSLGASLRKMEQYKPFITDMKYVGLHKIIVFVSSYIKANALVSEINSGCSLYRAYVPKHLVSITGVIPGIPTDIDVEDIKADIICEVPILEVTRMTRWDGQKRIPINRLSISFRAKELPSLVKIFCCVSRVKTFTPKVVICKNCLRFGHRTDNCRGARRCDRCTIRHEEEQDYANCQNQRKCVHCRSTEHDSTDANCPEQKRQLKIKTLMAKQNLTYTEAREEVPIISQNLYEPLMNIDEFPTVDQSYATMASGQYTWKDPLREQWIKTNQERKKIQAAVQIQKEEKEKQRGKKPRLTTQSQTNKTTETRNQIVKNVSSDGAAGVALQNPFCVTEKERWETMMQEAYSKSNRTHQEAMMSFYSDFIGMLGQREDIKNLFNACTKKHFNLANTVVCSQEMQQRSATFNN